MPSNPSQALYPREMVPLSHRLWQRQNQGETAVLQAMLTDWLDHVTEAEGMFKRFVYEKKDAQELDYRHHRMFLHALLADGESLVIMYTDLGFRTGKAEDFKANVTFIEQKLKELFHVLIEWHGPACAQPDVPESFKQAMREVQEGTIVDFKEP